MWKGGLICVLSYTACVCASVNVRASEPSGSHCERGHSLALSFCHGEHTQNNLTGCIVPGAAPLSNRRGSYQGSGAPATSSASRKRPNAEPVLSRVYGNRARCGWGSAGQRVIDTHGLSHQQHTGRFGVWHAPAWSRRAKTQQITCWGPRFLDILSDACKHDYF